MNVFPRVWSDDEIYADVAAGTEAFRRERFAEPLEKWLTEVAKRENEFRRLFEEHDVARPHDLGPEDLPGIVKDNLLAALRYLPGPPISEDDLKNLADAPSLARTTLANDPESAERVLDVIRRSVDPRRFPWLAENRNPTEVEKEAAIFASALLHAKERVAANRRNNSKTAQEQAVRDELTRVGFRPKSISEIGAGQYWLFPEPGQFSTGEVMLGGTRADLIATLWNRQVIAIECKVSNSAVNSNKRLNKDTTSKVSTWREGFAEMVVPAAVISGVFSPANVITAQAGGTYIFWSHRLTDLGEYVESTKQ